MHSIVTSIAALCLGQKIQYIIVSRTVTSLSLKVLTLVKTNGRAPPKTILRPSVNMLQITTNMIKLEGKGLANSSLPVLF